MSNVSFRLTAGTNVGCVRTNNEDNFIVNKDLTQKEWFLPNDLLAEIPLGKAGCLFVVADGMGGMNAGEVASDIAVRTIEEVFSIEDFSEIISSNANIEKFMKSAVEKADDNIKQRVKQDSSTSGMGTTIVVAWAIENIVHLVWCGDSRAYRFNRESGLTQLTKDHSYVQQLVDEGKLDPELAFDHPHSNIITRSLGDTQSKVAPDYISYELFAGDCIILCTDGLCGLCRDEEILATLNEQNIDDIVATRDALIQSALEAGGHDNVTVVLFQVVHTDTDNKKKDFSNTIAFRRKPLYKKTYIWVLLILFAITAFGAFAPDKWLGDKVAKCRCEFVRKVDDFASSTCDSITVKLKRMSQPDPEKESAAESNETKPTEENLLNETPANSEVVEELDEQYINEYNQNRALREHKAEKDKKFARIVEAEKKRKTEANERAKKARKAEEARKAAEEARIAEEARKAAEDARIAAEKESAGSAERQTKADEKSLSDENKDAFKANENLNNAKSETNTINKETDGQKQTSGDTTPNK